MRAHALTLMASLLLATSATATVFNVLWEFVKLSPEQNAALEREACTPHRVSLHSSEGMRPARFNNEEPVPDEEASLSATALCKTHTSIDNQPVAFEVSCHHEPGQWSCEPARETIDATFPDRRIIIHTENVSLQDAYDAVSHFVAIKAFAPGTRKGDDLRNITGPFDECSVESLEPQVLLISCQFFSARTQRNGTGWQLL